MCMYITKIYMLDLEPLKEKRGRKIKKGVNPDWMKIWLSLWRVSGGFFIY